MPRNAALGDSEVFRAILTTVRTYADGVTPPTTTTAVYGPYSGSKGATRAVNTHSGERDLIGSRIVTTGVVEYCPVVVWRNVKDAAKPNVTPPAPPIEFQKWPKTPRLFRDITITEKLDGTNAAIHVVPGEVEGTFTIAAQSRNRIITPESDNYGFGRWVHENALALARLLGPGLHFGEWWGRGIQRGYGLAERRFSLFNTDKHADVSADIGGAQVAPVPVLFRGAMSTFNIAAALAHLKANGSAASPGFMDPEGVCVFHHASRQVLKVTLDANDAGKWEAGA